MEPLFEFDEKSRYPSLTIADALGPSLERGTSTLTSAATTSAQVVQPVVSLQRRPLIQANSPLFDQGTHDLQVSASVSAFDISEQSNLGYTQSEGNFSVRLLRHMLSAFTDVSSAFYLCERPECTRYWWHFCKYYP